MVNILALASRFTLPVFLAFSVSESAMAQFGCSYELTCASSVAGDEYGGAVGYFQDFAFLGSPNAMTDGAVCVQRFDGTGWVSFQTLTSPAATGNGDGFGFSLSVSGNGRLVVGAPFEGAPGLANLGAAYVFERLPSGQWGMAHQLSPQGLASPHDRFGYSVDFDSRLVAVGADGDDTVAPESGAVYTYEWNPNASPTFEGKIVPPTAQASLRFGRHISAGDSGSRRFLMVGSPYERINGLADAGATYVFHEPGNSWPLNMRFVEPVPVAGALFGASVEAAGRSAFAGAPGADGGAGAESGIVYRYFQASSGSFSFTRTYAPDDHSPGDRFGTAVHSNGLDCIVTAAGDSTVGVNAGAVHYFRDVGSSAPNFWTAYPTAPSPAGRFGASLGGYGSRRIIGDPGAHSSGVGSGGATVIRAVGVDCNGNEVPDVCEILQPGADLNQNGLLDDCELIGTVYCSPAEPNSAHVTGGEIEAIGSPFAAAQDVILRAKHLPPNEFGMFLNSDTSGLVPFPMNSVGVLCLGGQGGSIGRFADDVQSSGTAGVLLLNLNLGALPRPGGPLMVTPGQFWRFQAWHRDRVNGVPTSNFTTAILVRFN